MPCRVMLTADKVPVRVDVPAGDPRELAVLAWDVLDSTGATADRWLVRYGGKDAWVERGHAVELEKADDYWTDKLMADPTVPRWWANRAVARAAANRFAGADADLTEALRMHPASADWLERRADVRSRLGHWPAAKQDIDRALKLGSPTAKLFTLRGAYYAALGNHRQATLDYAEAVKLDPGYADVFARRADSWEMLGQTARAADDHATAYKLAPHSWEVRLARAAFRGRLGDAAGAFTDLGAIELTAADDPAAQTALAWLLATTTIDDLRDGPRAVTVARHAVDLTGGTDPAAVEALAAAHAAADEFADAVAQQELAVTLPGVDPAARDRLTLYRDGQPYRDR